MKEARFFYVPNAGNQTMLPPEEAIHAIRVLRLKEGDEIHLIDGCGTFYKASVMAIDAKRCAYQIEERIPQTKTWNGRLCLAIAPTKMMERMEWMTEKATEIGFDEITFLKCTFSERKVIRTDRIEKIVVSAVKQSRKAWIPSVNDMQNFKDFITKERQGLKYIAHCYDEIGRCDFFDTLSAETINDNTDVTVLIGPEGDFSVEEVELAMKNGYKPITLGKSRLRTETAGLAAVMMMNIICRK